MANAMTRFRAIQLRVLLVLWALSAGSVAVWPAPLTNVERIPQRILLGMTTDPAHSQSVTWRTPASVDSPQAQFTLWSGNPISDSGATTVKASATTVPLGDGLQATHYVAVFNGLEPAKEYAYRVGDGTVWSEWNRFRLASARPERFRFLFLGDAQRDVKSQWSRVPRMAFIHAPDARFIAHAGDLVDEGYDDTQWGDWCNGLGFIGAWIPNLATPGNHDMNLSPAEAKSRQPVSVSPLWRAHFALPGNGPADAPMLEDEAYYVDYQGLRLISVEGNAFSDEDYDPEARRTVQKKEVEWLERILRDNPNRWTIVLHHEPIYKAGRNSDNPILRDALVPLYDKYHVDVVLQGHDHVYARTAKLAQGKVVLPSEPGTIYVVSVSGPRMYPFDRQYESLMARTLSDTQLFQVIEVDQERLRFDAYSVTGDRVDAFELRKSPENASTYTDVTAVTDKRPSAPTN